MGVGFAKDDGGLNLSDRFLQCLSSLFLKVLTEGAVTISSGRLFYVNLVVGR